MSGAQVDDIERRAKASVTTVKEEAARAETEEHKLAGGNNEARVYGDIIAEAVGLKAVTAAAELIGDRKADLAGMTAGGAGYRSRDIESDIALTNRPAGLYRNPHEQRKFGVVDTVSGAMAAKPAVSSAKAGAAHHEDIVASANITGASLNEQEKDAVGTWGVTETRMNSVQMAKKLTIGHELASGHALQSAHVARQQLNATMGMARTMAPGMDLSSGPRFNANQILKAAEEEADMNRWRTQS